MRIETRITMALFCVFALIMVSYRANAQDSRSEACAPFREAIQQWLADEDVSPDYYWLAVCESGCKPAVISHKGAVGIFQLMPWTSKHYRCDNPYEMECNTRAAARYIKHLHEYSPDMATVVQMFNQGGHNRVRNGSTPESRGLSQCVMSRIEEDKRESHVVYSNNECKYWYFSDSPDKHNPCGEDEKYVPENAIISEY